MEINFKKLNSFETLGLLIAAAGIALGVFLMISAMPEQQQAYVTKALSIFDIHEQASTEMQLIIAELQAPSEFMQQFYVAFTQVAVLPDPVSNSLLNLPSTLAALGHSIGSYADSLAFDYQLQVMPTRAIAYHSAGQVLGEMIVASDKPAPIPPPVVSPPVGAEQTSSDAQLQIPYSYQAPDFSKLYKLINQLQGR